MKLYRTPGTSPRVCSAGAGGKIGLFLRWPGPGSVCWVCHGIHYTGGTSWPGDQAGKWLGGKCWRHTPIDRLTIHLCSVSIVSTLWHWEGQRRTEISGESEIQRWLSNIVLDARVYVNTEQIVPMPRLRVNPTILWLPNIVISLVSIIYISSKHLFVHFLGGNPYNVMLTRYVSRFSVKYLLVVKCLLSGLMLHVARGSQNKIYWF